MATATEKGWDGWDQRVVPTPLGAAFFLRNISSPSWGPGKTEKRSSPATCSMLHSQSAPRVHQLIGSHVVPGDSNRHQYPQIDQ